MSGPDKTRREVLIGGASAVAASALPGAAASALEVPAEAAVPVINPWRDSLGNLRTDMMSPPGWRWNDCTGHWIHARVPPNLDWWAYCDANPGARKIYEDSLPARAWEAWDWDKGGPKPATTSPLTRYFESPEELAERRQRQAAAAEQQSRNCEGRRSNTAAARIGK